MKQVYVGLTSKAVVARALAFCWSLERTGMLSDNYCYILCLDEESRQIIRANTSSEHIIPISIEDVPAVKPFASRPIAQFAFACKPFLMTWALDNGATKVIYLDTDTWFTKNGNFLFDVLDNHDIFLVPAAPTVELIDNNWDSANYAAMKTGYYNAGIVACNNKAEAFLDWWSKRCAVSTARDFYTNTNGDQKYLNFVPGTFANVKIVRHLGLNVKHFTAQHLEVNRAESGNVLIEDDPLIYFHFSQNLANLRLYPQIFYPEISRYLHDLETARQVIKLPYIDMSSRADEMRGVPLIPRTGIQARLINLLDRVSASLSYLKKQKKHYGFILRRFIGLSSQLTPVLQNFMLERDFSGQDLEQLLTIISKANKEEPVLCIGLSPLSFYLADRKNRVSVIDPLQGYYHEELDKLFNLSIHEVNEAVNSLGIQQFFSLLRMPISEIDRSAELLIISSRLKFNDWTTALKRISQTKKPRLVILLMPSNHLAYQDASHQAIIDILGSDVECVSPILGVNVYNYEDK